MSNHSTLYKSMIIISLIFITSCGVELSDIEHVQRAKDYQDKGDLVSAIIELKNAANKNGKNPEARLLLGRIYLSNGNGVAAEKELNNAIQLGITDPQVELDVFESQYIQGEFDKIIDKLELNKYTNTANESRAQAILGKAYLEQNNIDLARALLKKSQALSDNADARAGLIKIKILAGEEVASELNEGLKLFPNSFNLNLVSADYHLYKKDFDKAIEYYSKTIDIRENVNVMLRRADLYVTTGKIALAQQDVDNVLLIEKTNPLANFIKGKISYQKGEFNDAKSALERVIAVLPNHLPTMALMGVVDFNLGNIEQAANELERYQSRAPGNPDVERLLAEAYIRLGQGEPAIRLLEKLAVKSAEDPSLYLMLGNAYLQSANLDKAKQNLSLAQELATNEPIAGNQLAVLNILTGESEEAANNLQQALQGQQANKQGEILLIWALLQSKELDKALEFADLGVAKEPKDALRLFVRGVVRQRRGDTEKAKEDFYRTLETDKQFILANIGLAEISVKEQDYPLAENYFKKVLAIKPDHLGSLLGLSLIEDKRNNSKGTLAWLKKAHELTPEASQPVEALVNIYINRGDLEAAKTLAQQFQNKNKQSQKGILLSAKALLAGRDYLGAGEKLRHYLELHPGEVGARLLLIEVLRRQPDLDAAILEANNLLLQNKNSPLLMTPKIRLLLQAGRVNEAKAMMGNLSEMGLPEDIYFELSGDIALAEHFNRKAFNDYKRAYAVSENYGLLRKLVNLATSLNETGATEEQLRQYIAKTPDNLDAQILLASFLEAQGKTDDAKLMYQALLDIDAHNLAALNNLANIYAQNGEMKQALLYAKEAYGIFDSAPEVMDTYGWVLVRDGQLEKGVDLLKKAHEGLPGNQEVSYHLAVALGRLKRNDEFVRVSATITDQYYQQKLKNEAFD